MAMVAKAKPLRQNFFKQTQHLIPFLNLSECLTSTGKVNRSHTAGFQILQGDHSLLSLKWETHHCLLSSQFVNRAETNRANSQSPQEENGNCVEAAKVFLFIFIPAFPLPRFKAGLDTLSSQAPRLCPFLFMAETKHWTKAT